jgi:adenylate cyclase class IV
MSGQLPRTALAMIGGLAVPVLAAVWANLPWLGYLAAGLAVGLLLAWLPSLVREWRHLDRAAGGHCLECGYSLEGLPDAGRCPECGSAFGIADFGNAAPAPGESGGRDGGMAANVEIKARVRDLPALERAATALSGVPPTVLGQEDTFFPVPRGRLKLRRLAADRGELIYYDRPNEAGPKQSQYSIARAAEPDALATVLSRSLGTAGVVRKERRLYLVGQTRIHLDRVDGLGDFVELEVVLRPGQSTAEGHAIAAGLMRQLGIQEDDLVAGAYLDLQSISGPVTRPPV